MFVECVFFHVNKYAVLSWNLALDVCVAVIVDGYSLCFELLRQEWSFETTWVERWGSVGMMPCVGRSIFEAIIFDSHRLYMSNFDHSSVVWEQPQQDTAFTKLPGHYRCCVFFSHFRHLQTVFTKRRKPACDSLTFHHPFAVGDFHGPSGGDDASMSTWKYCTTLWSFPGLPVTGRFSVDGWWGWWI